MAVGTVYLVGAGPGAPELITVRGLELIRAAEVIVYDRLISPALIEEAPASSQKIFVGKTAGYHSLPQEEISTLLIEHARAGSQVVRLKGGDPFVFGRGGEEIEALTEAGVPYEIVPGVSAAIAVPGYAGIPLTHRRLSSSFAVVTGHEACKPDAKVDWARLATAVDTLVVLMGLSNLPRITAALIAHGRAPQTPAAVIGSGTTEKQRVVVCTLDDIAERANSVPPPAVIVIGEVVGLVDPIEIIGAAPKSGAAVYNGKPSATES